MTTKQKKYIPITTDDLKLNTILDFDIFVQTGKNVVLFRKSNQPFAEETLRNLAANKVRTIFIAEEDIGKFEEYSNSIKNNSNTQFSREDFDAPFDNPEIVEKHYKTYFNYYPIEKDTLLPGSKVNFNVYKKLDIDVDLYFGPDNQSDLSDIVPVDVHKYQLALAIHNDDIPLYKDYIRHISLTYSKNKEISSELQYSIMRENSKLIIKDVLEDPRSGETIQKASDLVESLTGVILDNKSNFYKLLRITTHDYYTYTHSLNVCSMCIGLGAELGLRRDPDLLELGLGALLHDIGKCSVDPRILNKPGRLADDEFKSIQHHVLAAKELLKGRENEVPEKSLYTIFQHHEKLSGKGYPFELKGNQIHLFGRIGAIVDFYDALTTERSYKKAYTPFESFRLLREIKDDYDQRLIKRFIVMLGDQVGNNQRY